MKTPIYRNWNALVNNFNVRLFDSCLGNKLLASLLTAALLAPILLFGSHHNVSAYSPSAPAKKSAPVSSSAPPVPFITDSENHSSGNSGALLAVTNPIAAVEDFFTAPLAAAPEDSESVKPVSLANNPADDDDGKADNGETSGFISPTSSRYSVTEADSVSAPTNPTPFGQLSSGADFDYDGDGKADAGRWRSSAAEYKIRRSLDGTFTTQTLGTSSSKMAPGDYDGDGKTDFAVFTGNGNWTIKYSQTGTTSTITHGQTGDTPAVGDYDGDGKSDLAVTRIAVGMMGGQEMVWRIRYSSTGTAIPPISYGLPGDISAPGKYDNDNKTDIAVFRPSTGYWHILKSTNGETLSYQWGNSTDVPVPADYADADALTDIAVYRKSSGEWYVLDSQNNFTTSRTAFWGNYGDQPVPADYDGDGKADYAIRRPASGTWHILKSSNGGTEYHTNGLASDQPVQAAYLKPIGFEMYSYDFAKVRLSPKNETGGTDYYSRNFFWGTSLVGLPGRAGLDAGLGVAYNSLVWTRNTANNQIYFDTEGGTLSPGFRFGFPVIEPIYKTGQPPNEKFNFLMITPSGEKVEFRQATTSNIYETADSTYAQLKINGAANPNSPAENLSLTVTTTDGTQMLYEWRAGGYRCQQIKDRNGNYITINHDAEGLLRTITDTLGRVMTVNYDSMLSPISMTQTWKNTNGTGANITHTYATFAYEYVTLNPSFASNIEVVGAYPGSTVKFLKSITYDDGSKTQFDYNNYGQVKEVANYAPNAGLLSRVRTNLMTPDADAPAGGHIDCPRLSQTKTWVKNFNQDPQTGVEQEVVVSNELTQSAGYNLPGGLTGNGAKIVLTMTDHPNGAVSNIYVGNTGYKEGYTLATEDFSTDGGSPARERWTWNEWTQDDTSKDYITNPRVIETRVGDEVNTKKTTIAYDTNIVGVAAYGLVKEVKVYDSDLQAILKEVRTDYKSDAAYTSRRVIGLPEKVEVSGRNQTNGQFELVSKATYEYDEGNFSDATLEQNPVMIQRDAVTHPATLIIGRGNLTSMKRWNVEMAHRDNPGSAEHITSSTKYNTAGAPVAQFDPLNRMTKISYLDSFNDNLSRNAYAYPTRLTDAAGNFSEVKYRFDIGANVWAKSPAPAGNVSGKETTREFDQTAGRLLRETMVNTSAYTRYEYPTSGVQSKMFSTVVDTNGNNTGDAADEVLMESWTDGAGRVRQSRTEHPNSAGGWSSSKVEYDILGRVSRSSVPTEINPVNPNDPDSWTPAGDDATRGWLWTQQTYDWRDRVTRVIASDSNGMDGKDQLFSYEGCGCAGGEVVTIRSEEVPREGQPAQNARRTQKVYSDILSRTFKTEVLNWDSSIYSTVKTTFNGRDQATLVRQYSGTETSQTFQDTTMSYDGHGRMITRHNPIEDAGKNTTWSYNKDDAISQIVDPRGATTTYVYNDARGLLTNMTYAQPPNNPAPSDPRHVPAAAPVTFAYDAAGNRISMTDGTGSTTYNYDQLSRITSETRQFSGLSNSFAIEYEYTLSGGLKQMKDPSDSSRNLAYTYNKAGVLTAIAGGGFGGVTNLMQNREVRAWGATKRETYGNNYSLERQFDTRQRVSLFNVRNQTQTDVMKIEYQYTASSNLKRANNVLNGNFSWNFIYDHVGRLKSTETDPAPQIGSASYHSVGYDAWDNMTHRTIGIWGTSYVGNYDNIYQNNRNIRASAQDSQSGVQPDEIWQYDAGGMPTVTGQQKHKYDAAGRKIESVDTPPQQGQPGRTQLLIQQTYDGNGQTAKRYEQETFTVGSPRISTIYYLRSSVLGGKLWAQVTPDGQNGVKGLDYVYNSDGEVIAERSATLSKWIYVAPALGNRFEADATGTTSGGDIYDPFGGVIPPQPPPPGSPDWIYSGNYQQSGNPSDGNGGCSQNGFPVDCSDVVREVSLGDPRSLNDTCPSCGAGGGMWLSEEQLEKVWRGGFSFDSLSWIGRTRMGGDYNYLLTERGRIKGGNSFAPNLNRNNPRQQTQQKHTGQELMDAVWSKFGQKIEDCMKKLMIDYAKRTITNKSALERYVKDVQKTKLDKKFIPQVDATRTMSQVNTRLNFKKDFSFYALPSPANVYIHKKDTVIIARQFWIDENQWKVGSDPGLPGRSPLENAYVHEYGNIISYYVTGNFYGFNVEKEPSDEEKKKGASWDPDSGWIFQKCVFGN